MNNLKTLHLVSSSFDFLKKFPGATLLTCYQKNISPGIYYTSIHDTKTCDIIRLSLNFDRIEFEPDEFQDKDSRDLTFSLYQYLSQIVGKSTVEPVQFTDHQNISNRFPEPTLWIFGCSHSHGIGLSPDQPSYGKIISDHINMPLKLITKPGSSLNWSLRHLMNSPIQEYDIVIWQLTLPTRVSIFDNGAVKEVMLPSSKNKELIKIMSEDQMYFTQLSLLNIGYRYLKSIKCKFLLTVPINPYIPENFKYIGEYIKYPEYAGIWDVLDFGLDNCHGGPLTHAMVAKHLLNQL